MEEEKQNQSEEKQPLEKRLVKELWEMVKIFAICLVTVFLITTFIAKPVRIEGSSMYPTLEDEEIGITNVFSARFLGIERGDIVIIKLNEADEHWVKRVIGMPGDTISAKDDVVYVNGKALDESYLNKKYVKSVRSAGNQFTSDFDEVKLKDDEYFLMGDNRIRSEDSRRHGPFTQDEIIGKDVLIIYPFDKIKVVKNEAK